MEIFRKNARILCNKDVLPVFQSLHHIQAFEEARNWSDKINREITVFLQTKSSHLDRYLILYDRVKCYLDEIILFIPNNHSIGIIDCKVIDFKEGIATSWNDKDLLLCSKEFIRAKLYHLYPIWPICKSFCILIHAITNAIKGCMKLRYDIWLRGMTFCYELCQFLLRTEADFNILSKDNILSFSSKMRHSIDVFRSIRGFAWEKKLRCLAEYGCKTMNEEVKKALEDQSLYPEARISLEVFSMTIWTNQSTGDDTIPQSPDSSVSKRLKVDRLDSDELYYQRMTKTERVIAVKRGEVDVTTSKLIFDLSSPSHLVTLSETDSMKCVTKAIVYNDSIRINFASLLSYLENGNTIMSLQDTIPCIEFIEINLECSSPEDLSASQLKKLFVEQVGMYCYLRQISLSNVRGDDNSFMLRLRSGTSLRIMLEEQKCFCEGLSFRINKYGQSELWCTSWCENKLWSDLLHLLMLDEISDPNLPFAEARWFNNKPIDYLPEHYSEKIGDIPPIRSNGFYIRRFEKITKKLEFISNLTPQELQNICYSNFDKYCLLKDQENCWGFVNRKEMASIAVAIGGGRLSVIFKALLQFPETYWRGCPDLVFWKANTPLSKNMKEDNKVSRDEPPFDKSNFLVVEVKSKNDYLSKWQIAWKKLFHEANIPYEILRVNDLNDQNTLSL